MDEDQGTGDQDFAKKDRNREPKTVDESSTTAIFRKQHADKCACGCVPNILSLFEMAELRAKRKAASQKP